LQIKTRKANKAPRHPVKNGISASLQQAGGELNNHREMAFKDFSGERS